MAASRMPTAGRARKDASLLHMNAEERERAKIAAVLGEGHFLSFDEDRTPSVPFVIHEPEPSPEEVRASLGLGASKPPSESSPVAVPSVTAAPATLLHRVVSAVRARRRAAPHDCIASLQLRIPLLVAASHHRLLALSHAHTA